VEPTPIFAALVAPSAGGTAHGAHDDRRHTVREILRALDAEDTPPATSRGRVGHVPGVLSFRARG
jgi:hypothetical protein